MRPSDVAANSILSKENRNQFIKSSAGSFSGGKADLEPKETAGNGSRLMPSPGEARRGLDADQSRSPFGQLKDI
jgi:hypothetical protein